MVLRPPIIDLYVSILLKSEYNILFYPKFYYTSVICELLTLSLSLSLSLLLQWQIGDWVDWILGVVEASTWSLIWWLMAILC